MPIVEIAETDAADENFIGTPEYDHSIPAVLHRSSLAFLWHLSRWTSRSWLLVLLWYTWFLPCPVAAPSNFERSRNQGKYFQTSSCSAFFAFDPSGDLRILMLSKIGCYLWWLPYLCQKSPGQIAQRSRIASRMLMKRRTKNEPRLRCA